MAIAYLNEVCNVYHRAGGDSTTAGTVNSGSDLVLVLTIHTFDSTGITSIAWNGDALTQVGTWNRYGGANDWMGTFILVNPDVGSFNMVVDRTDANRHAFACVVYSGCKQTGQPDASSAVNSGSATTLSRSVASVADNCWHIFTLGENSSAPSSYTNVTSRSQNNGNGNVTLGDSNSAKTPAGTLTQDATWSGATGCGAIQLTLAPSASTSTANAHNNLLLLGVS